MLEGFPALSLLRWSYSLLARKSVSLRALDMNRAKVPMAEVNVDVSWFASDISRRYRFIPVTEVSLWTTRQDLVLASRGKTNITLGGSQFVAREVFGSRPLLILIFQLQVGYAVPCPIPTPSAVESYHSAVILPQLLPCTRETASSLAVDHERVVRRFRHIRASTCGDKFWFWTAFSTYYNLRTRASADFKSPIRLVTCVHIDSTRAGSSSLPRGHRNT